MRVFVHFDRQGNIVSVSKVDWMHPDLAHPHGGLNQGDEVIEIDPEEKAISLDPHEIANQYSMDVKKYKLRKRRK